jgi:hypothetical protein
MTFVIGIILSSSITMAFASRNATSANGYFTVYGINYENSSYVFADTNGVSADCVK